MGIFGKLKGAKKAADEHKAQEAPSPEDVAKPRYVHVPTHAARDAMSIAPSGWKGSDKELITQANKARMSRTGSDFESYFYRSPNPKFARSSSGLSMSGDWNGSAGPSAPSSPMGSRPQSYQSLPRLMHEGPPVPAIPSQYAGQSTSPVLGAGNRDSSSFNGVPSKRRLSRTTSGLGKSPVQNYYPSPVDSANNSSAASTSSEELEIQTQQKPATYDQSNYLAQFHTNPHRALGEAPRRDDKKYFGHSSVTPVAEPKAAPTPAVTPKKGRFSFMKKSPTAVAAH